MPFGWFHHIIPHPWLAEHPILAQSLDASLFLWRQFAPPYDSGINCMDWRNTEVGGSTRDHVGIAGKKVALEILEAKFPEDTAEVRALFLAYAQSLPVDLEFQNFNQELAALPCEYAPSAGRLLLARSDGEPAGCVGLKPRSATICEMKRLFVLPPFRSEGAGRRLAEAVIVAARAVGYHTLLLDSLPSMEAAQALYRRLGFKEKEPCYETPVAGAKFMRLELTGG